jgi:ATP-binding cassette subfamily C protein CydC
MALVTGLHSSLSDLATSLAIVAALVLAVPLVAGGEIQGVYLAFLALVVLGSFEAVVPLGTAFQYLGRSLSAGERLFEISDAEPTVTDPKKPSPPPRDHTLRFDRVGFRYEPGGPPALEDVTFALKPSRRVAVVGPSGSGKSTISHLALRFWDAQRGEVSLGGRDVRDYSQQDLRYSIGIVSQDTHLFNDTLRANLLIARPDASDDELTHAIAEARLSELLVRLPEGLETPLGEHGLKLSGGERQRLSVARALLKDAPLLILDEPTANLDPITEREVLDAIYDGLARERATLIITHRLVRMEEMDEILVLEAGRAIERGTHAKLVEAGGAYARMLEVQNGMLLVP